MGRPLAEGIDPVGLKNTLGQQIDPGTEETLQDILAALGGSGSYTTITSGNKSVAVAGTAERIVAISTPCKKITITARMTNADTVVIGDLSVIAALPGRTGTPLIQGQSYDLQIDDANKIYVNSVENSDGVSFNIFN